jgi:hypothetical protein
MGAIEVREGLPQTAHDGISCPFCGDACYPASETSSSFGVGSVYVALHYHCLSGCCWELRILSRDGDLQVGCVLLGIDQELREQHPSADFVST